ncbi:TonB family protein [Ottowia sp.]|uniref:energy transducer TonB n=1 Tax=Ottowia sp. TaxID=1898956 RepID=UPI002BBC3213|nr:TonB family protein [Ottowia sp.]HRQ02931.1 TonB family protein [Ottowia sp.]
MRPRFPAPGRLSTLQWALLASALLHGVLLSVRLVDSEGFRRAFARTTLDVVLVNARSDEKPEQAQAIAQADLAGGGEAGDRRLASTPLPPHPQALPGDDAASEHQRRIAAMLTQQEELLTQVRKQLHSAPAIEPRPPSDDTEAQAEEERRLQLSKLLAAIERRVEESNAQPRKRYLSPATLGATYAPYYDDMRRRIEARGTRHFPEAGGRKLYGELLMALLVNHDGRIIDARVVQGSGNRALDRQAEAIARAAAPFGRFSAAMRRDTDQFDVTARFRFTREQTLETSLQTGQGRPGSQGAR